MLIEMLEAEKNTTSAKRMLKINVNTSNCDNMGYTKKTVIHIPKPRVRQYLL